MSRDVAEVVAIAERRAEQFAGADWTGLAAVGEHGDLVGRRVSDLRVGEASSYRATLGDEAVFEDLPTDDGSLPYVVSGTISGPSDDPPPEHVVAVNGRIAGVVGGYDPSGNDWDFLGYVADFYVDGANTVELYEVRGEEGATTLHRVGR